MAALYANHPYGIPIIGWEHEIAALNREDALSYYKRFYAPNNAILTRTQCSHAKICVVFSPRISDAIVVLLRAVDLATPW